MIGAIAELFQLVRGSVGLGLIFPLALILPVVLLALADRGVRGGN